MPSGEVLDRPYMLPADENRRVAERLIRARRAAGYATGSSFARENGFSVSTYLCHENASRGLNAETEAAYAAKLNLLPGTILYGGALPRSRDVPIVGTIGERDAKVTTMPLDASADGERAGRIGIIHINLNGLVAHEIADNELYPVYRAGDYAMHLPIDVDAPFEVASVHGQECICRLADGRELLRQVTVQRDGRCTLIAYHAPPLIDVRVVAAVPVELIVRNARRR
jgi:hypothetical protein